MKRILKYLLAAMILLAILAVAVSCLKRREVARFAALAATKQVAVLPHPGKDEDPSLLRGADGTYWLVWFSERGEKPFLWMTRSADGEKWAKPWQITSGPGGDYYPSLIQTRDGGFCLVWFRQASWMGVRNILFAKGDRQGRNWSPPKAITKQLINNWAPCLMEDARGILWIVWSSNQDHNKNLFLVRSENHGDTWSAPRRITGDADEDDFPYMAQGGSEGYILVWTRFRPGWTKSWLPNSSSETMMSRSKDGAHWGKPQPLTRDKFVDGFPIISAAGRRDSQGAEPLAVWTTTRYSRHGDLAGLSLSESMKYPAVPFQLNAPQTHGYTARLAPTEIAGRYLMVWVSKNAEGDLEIFRQFVRRPTPQPSQPLPR